MAGERVLTLDFVAEIPLQAVTGQPYGVEARIYGTISGTVDSKVAASVVDPNHELPPAEIAGRIKANMIGWLQYAAIAAFQEALQRPGVDLAAATTDAIRFVIPNRYSVAIVLLYPAVVLTAPVMPDWTSAMIAETYAYAVDNGAQIISTSYDVDSRVGDPVFVAGLQYLYDQGGLHFNSAGNNN